jgi:hypothetical protein
LLGRKLCLPKNIFDFADDLIDAFRPDDFLQYPPGEFSPFPMLPRLGSIFRTARPELAQTDATCGMSAIGV